MAWYVIISLVGRAGAGTGTGTGTARIADALSMSMPMPKPRGGRQHQCVQVRCRTVRTVRCSAVPALVCLTVVLGGYSVDTPGLLRCSHAADLDVDEEAVLVCRWGPLRKAGGTLARSLFSESGESVAELVLMKKD